MRGLAIFIMVLWVGSLHAQPAPSFESEKPNRSYQLLRQDEDWSFLADPANRQDFWDLIKYTRLRAGADDFYMTVGGEARQVWEQIGNDNWGQSPINNGYLNQRYMLVLDVR